MKVSTVLYLSTGVIGLPLLTVLCNDPRFKVVGLICQPDNPKGKTDFEQMPAIKRKALELGLPVYQPKNINEDIELFTAIQRSKPDFVLTFAYGQILKKPWLELALKETLNVHPSLLPKYRGATPFQTALLKGETHIGISLMKMVQKMDAGSVYRQLPLEIESEDTSETLQDKIADLASENIPDLLAEFDKLMPTEQDDSQVTFSKMFTRDDGYIDFKQSAEEILLKMRAFIPWPGTWTTFNGKRLKLLDMEISTLTLKPGQVRWELPYLYVGTLSNALKLNQLQLEGRKTLLAKDFILGNKDFMDTQLPS